MAVESPSRFGVLSPLLRDFSNLLKEQAKKYIITDDNKLVTPL